MFYVLNADDPKAVKAVATKKAAHSFGNGLWVFSTAEELQEVAGSASMATIDGIYNALTGNSVGKARDKAASCARLFKAVLNAAPVTAGEAEATSGNGADINGSDALSKQGGWQGQGGGCRGGCGGWPQEAWAQAGRCQGAKG